MHFYLVAPTARVHSQGLFTYSSPLDIPNGSVVLIEIGKRQSVGVVIKKVNKPTFATKEIVRTLEKRPLPQALLELASWLTNYYASPTASVWQTILPRGLDKKRRITDAKSTHFTRKKSHFELNSDQKKAIKNITKEQSSTSLLQGITGSGKTAVYIELAKKTVLKDKKSVIILVPEIALTSQLVTEFLQHFEDILLTHSDMTEAQRHIVWQKALQTDTPKIIIGPRSALFLPVKHIGLIVIDEAHEPSFKQEQSPRYSALRAAKILATSHGAKLLLGSATPSVSDKYLAEISDSQVIRLDTTAKKIGKVDIQLIDSRKRTNFSGHRFFSNQLIKAIEETLALKQQVILFHNRRGSAPTTLCENCGWSAICPRCFIPLTLHADKHLLICHVCGLKEKIPTTCPECNKTSVIHKGIGTKLIAEEIGKLFPTARIARFDGDNQTHETLEKMYQEIYDGKIDIIVGTQVVAKGLDLPNLSSVGIIQADSGLNLPDFGASERVFQLLYQVMGRVGRDEKLSKIVIQTFQPDNTSIKAAIERNYDSFYSSEITKRQRENFPPFTYLLKLTCAYKTESSAADAALKLKNTLLMSASKSIQILGPAPAFYERTRDTYRWQIILKSPNRKDLIDILSLVPPTKWQTELDPVSLL